MIENRPIVAITIGYILGIIMGLYCKISIVFLYPFFLVIYSILNKLHKNKFKLVSIKRYSRYLKIFFTKNVCIIVLISAFISNSIIIYKNNKIDEFLNSFNNKEIQLNAKVISNGKIKKYNKKYIIKCKEKKFCINVKNNVELDYGDTIFLKGTFIKPRGRTNYMGFSYLDYYKSQGIYGTINVTNVKTINKKKDMFNEIFLNLKKLIQKNFNQEISNTLLGIIVGYTEEIREDIRENFNDSNVSHIFAVSGMHIGYLVMFCNIILKKAGKRKIYYFSIVFILLYFKIVKFTPSVTRATIMTVSVLMSKLLYRKNDSWTMFCLSLLCLLIYNPFLINNISLIFSFLATFWIILYNKLFKKKDKKILNRIINTISMTISLMIFILPVMAIYFHKIPILSIIIGLIIGIIAGPIFILGIIFVLFGKIINLKIIKKILEILIYLVLRITGVGGKIPLNKVYVIIPNILEVIIYYSFIFISIFLFLVFKQKKIRNQAFIKRVKNLLSLLKYRYNQNKKKIISTLIIIIFSFLILNQILFQKKLKIYFLDVGQGDSCLIVTPNNKKILIDGGGSEDFDIGKNTLIPYLLARKITHLDYLIISHFDTDHVGGLLTVMEELKVSKVVISKQGENSENYRRFEQIVKDKKIKIKAVAKGDKLTIERNLYFDILWPNNGNLISENALNNNSIVCKLIYNNFSMIFTGDIEEIAEKQILQEYKYNLGVLNSKILKVAHHGSKTSSIKEFIDVVTPKISLIGVGENNKFGHPNEEVITRLKTRGTRIYRTDQNGEILVIVDKKGTIKLKKYKN